MVVGETSGSRPQSHLIPSIFVNGKYLIFYLFIKKKKHIYYIFGKLDRIFNNIHLKKIIHFNYIVFLQILSCLKSFKF